MEFEVRYKKSETESQILNIKVLEKGGKYEVESGKRKELIDTAFLDNSTISLLIHSKSHLAKVITQENKKVVILDGKEYIFEEKYEDEEIVATGRVKIENIIKSPMPGSVVKINVKEGEEIKKGKILIIVEAMKMENEIRAPVDVRIEKVFVKEKEQVDGMQPLMELIEINNKEFYPLLTK